MPEAGATAANLGSLTRATDPGVDWELDEDGDLIFPLRYTAGAGAVAQGIRLRALMIQGEWFADKNAGVDYFGSILGKKFDELSLQDIFRKVLTSTPGVDEIVLLTATFNRVTRTATINFRVRTEFGIIAGSIGGV